VSESRSNNSSSGEAAAPPVAAEFVGALEGFLTALEADQASAGTLDAYRRDLERYLSMATANGIDHLTDLSPQHVAELMDMLLQAEFSPATIARNLSSIRRFHDHLLRSGASSADPTRDVSVPRVGRPDPNPLTMEEAERLVTAVNADDPRSLRDRAMLEIFYATGLRVSELIALHCGDLTETTKLLHLQDRGGRDRIVPLGEAAVVSLCRYVKDGRPHLAVPSTDDTLFLNVRGESLSRMGVWKIVRAAAVAARIDRTVNPQTLRHTFAAHLLDGGALLQDVQHLLGHADIASTQIYAREYDADLTQLHRTYHPRA
jgi:integrase/recombinase XerD